MAFFGLIGRMLFDAEDRYGGSPRARVHYDPSTHLHFESHSNALGNLLQRGASVPASGNIKYMKKAMSYEQGGSFDSPGREHPPPLRPMASVEEYQDDEERLRLIQEQCKQFELTNEDLHKIMESMLSDMERGLADPDTSVIKMLPSFVRAVPNGSEKGEFLALDLGGTNFRVLLIRLSGDGNAEMEGKIYRVPHDIMTGTGAQLFDHIAECMAKFVKEHKLDSQLPLGFTFSFPCSQHGLTSAKLLTWTKGFTASDVEGEDVVKLLQDAVHRRGDVEIDVVALLNDTVGTQMACALKEPDCYIGVIVGTGSNACYMEKIDKCPKLNGILDDDGPDEIIINTEWGAFGSDGSLDFIRTQFDKFIDSHSINPGKQIFEKMISGMYMGELVRLVLEGLTKAGLLFEGQGSDELYSIGSFPTKYVSEIEEDLDEEERTFQSTFNILEDLGLSHISPADCAHVAYICQVVSARAAYLCAAGISVLINRMQRPHCVVGVDGSVYRFHPTFKQLLDSKIEELVDPNLQFHLMLSEDGSGKGAALVAAVACRVEQERLERARLREG